MGRQARPARVARRDPRQGLPGEDGAGNCRFLRLGRRESFRTFEQVPKRKDLRTCAACNLKESLPFCDFSKSARLPLAPRRNLCEAQGKVRIFKIVSRPAGVGSSGHPRAPFGKCAYGGREGLRELGSLLLVLTILLRPEGPAAQWIRHRPTEPGIAGSSPAGVICWLYQQ